MISITRLLASAVAKCISSQGAGSYPPLSTPPANGAKRRIGDRRRSVVDEPAIAVLAVRKLAAVN